MNGTATFGSISRTANSTTADVFIAKYNNSLSTCYWAFNFGGTGSAANSICAGLSVDQENNAIITGQLYGTNADVDPSAATLNLSSIGNNDCFVIKYNSNGQLWVNDTTSVVAGVKELFQNRIHVFPNPTTDYIYIHSRLKESFMYNIYNAIGVIVKSGVTFSQINVSSLPIGIYIIEISDRMKNKLTTTKILKQ
jgi:hypothetical protein